MAPGLPEHPDHLIRRGTTRHDCKSILELRPPTDASRVQTHICDKEGFSSPKSPLLQPGRVPKAPTMWVGGGFSAFAQCSSPAQGSKETATTSACQAQHRTGLAVASIARSGHSLQWRGPQRRKHTGVSENQGPSLNRLVRCSSDLMASLPPCDKPRLSGAASSEAGGAALAVAA